MAYDPTFSFSQSVSVPSVLLGATYSFTITVTGVQPGMPVIVNVTNQSFLASIYSLNAYVSSANTVTVWFKALLAVSSGSITFFGRVLP